MMVGLMVGLKVLYIFYILIIVVLYNLLVCSVVQLIGVILNAFGYFMFIVFMVFSVLRTDSKSRQTLIIKLPVFVEPRKFYFYLDYQNIRYSHRKIAFKPSCLHLLVLETL
jgi:hypothetical protein